MKNILLENEGKAVLVIQLGRECGRIISTVGSQVDLVNNKLRY